MSYTYTVTPPPPANDLVIVGSSDLWVTPEIVSIVVGRIAATEAGSVIRVRAPRAAPHPVTPLEKLIWEIGPSMDRVVHLVTPSTNKRNGTYQRDYELVENAKGVLAFFAPDQEMEGGTGHVVQAALNKNIPVEAYRMNDDGRPELMGSDDGLVPGGDFNSGGYIIPNQISGTFTGTATTSNYSAGIFSNSGTFTVPNGITFAPARHQAGTKNSGGNGS